MIILQGCGNDDESTKRNLELDVFQGSCMIFKYKVLIKSGCQSHQLLHFYGKRNAKISNKSNEKSLFYFEQINHSFKEKPWE